ncbi:MAG TPA: terminase family protein [Candidatus Paceibacterota bacterium]|nr:terminase family protein [Candidatus Paceibacterota bacterium]
MAQIEITIDDFNPRQEEIAKDIVGTSVKDTKYFIIRASRQSGKTFLIERLALYYAFSKSGLELAFVNALHKQNEKVYLEMTKFIPEKLIYKAVNSDTRRYIKFINGSTIQFYTARNYDAIVGSSFDYFFGDEVALWAERAWTYIQPVVAAKQKAKVILSSTPRGMNHFYKLCTEAEGPDPFKKEYRMLYSDNPFYDLREVEDAKKNSTEFAFRQEYLAEFVFGRGMVFGEFGHLQKRTDWELPKQGKRYFFGLDIAGSGDDSTVLTIMDEEGNPVFIYEAENERIPNQARELAPHIARYDAEGFGECNGLGLGLIEELQDMGLKISKFWMSNESKNEIVDNTLRDIANEHCSFPTVELCSKLDNQMSTYEVSRTQSGKLTYSHPKGLNDDYVDSYNISNWARYKFLFGGRTQVWDPAEQRDKEPNLYPTTIDMRKDYSDIYGQD